MTPAVQVVPFSELRLSMLDCSLMSDLPVGPVLAATQAKRVRETNLNMLTILVADFEEKWVSYNHFNNSFDT